MKRGIVLLLLLYVVGVSAIVAGELTNLNGIKRSLGEPEVGYAEYFSVNAVRILTSPWVVVRELQEENQRLSQQWLERQRERSQKILESLASRGVSREGNGKTVSQGDTSAKRVEEKRNATEERSARSYSEELRSKSLRISPSSPEARLRVTNLTLLRSYSELLSALEEKLRRWDFRGELYIEDFNGSSLAELSEEDLLTRIREQEERINELARQTGRRKIDYGGVEINRFRGKRYFVFLKKEFPEVTVAWRPGFDPKDVYKHYQKTQEAFIEFFDLEKREHPKFSLYFFNPNLDHHEKFVEAIGGGKSWTKGRAKCSGDEFEIQMYPDYSDPERWEYLLSHELVHCFDDIYMGKGGIDLLEEGYCGYIPINIVRIGREDPMRWDENLSVWDIINNYGHTSNAERGSYQLSYWFVRFLVEKYGKEKFKAIVETAGRGIYKDAENRQSLNHKLKKIYGKTLDELENEFQAWTRSKKVD